MIVERFDPGSSNGLMELVTVHGVQRTATFYQSARLDGLVKREENIGQKMIETFEGRDDQLIYRSVSYFPRQQLAPEPESDKPVNPNRLNRKKKVEEPLQPIRKMTEKFSQVLPDEYSGGAGGGTSALDKKEQLARRTFYVSLGQIKLQFHYGMSRITASTRHYTKDGVTNIVNVDPLEEAPRDSELYEEFQALVESERKCMNDVRDSEKQIQDMIQTRSKEEQNIVLLSPYYDIVRCKTELSEEDEAEGEEKQESDYLSPFLPPMIAGQSITPGQAFEVRDKALRALQDRLIERANIIQARHDEQTALLAKRAGELPARPRHDESPRGGGVRARVRRGYVPHPDSRAASEAPRGAGSSALLRLGCEASAGPSLGVLAGSGRLSYLPIHRLCLLYGFFLKSSSPSKSNTKKTPTKKIHL